MSAFRIKFTAFIINIGLVFCCSVAIADSVQDTKPPLAAGSGSPLEKTSTSPVLVKVNGHAITQAELDSVSIFPLASIKDEDLRYRARNKILRDLIDEYLAEQAIVDTKLDNDPIFKPLLEREKRTAALNLYTIYTASRLPIDVTKSDIDGFIRSHQEFFADRRTFHFIQYILPPNSNNSAPYSLQIVKDFTSKFTQTQFMTWLIDQGIDFQRINVWQGTEQMSPAVLAALSNLKAGSVVVEKIGGNQGALSSTSQEKNDNGIRVLYLIDSYPDPISAEESRNSVARNLISLKQKANMVVFMQELRANAKIEILDEKLKVEITKLNQQDSSQANERRSARRLEYMRTAWFFCLILLVSFALWQFFKSVPVISKKEGALQSLQILEQTVFMRSLETLLIGSLLFFPLVRFIFERLVNYDNKVVILSGVLGVSVAIALFWAIKKVPLLRELNQNRFLAVTLLLLVQYLILAV